MKSAEKKADKLNSSSTKGFDIALYIGAFCLAVAMILILFNLKWQQNARIQAEETLENDVALSLEMVNEELDAANGETVPENEIDTGAELVQGTEPDDESVTEQGPESEPVGLVVTDDDVIFFLGGDFASLQQRFANSEQILGAENHYFVDEYLGVVYDEDTMEVMCLENDGPGKMPIKLAGLNIGMSKEELCKLLNESDIDYTESVEDNTIKYNWHANETIKYKAEIEFEDDHIIDIICRVR